MGYDQKKRRGMSQKPLVTAMSVCIGVLACIFVWSAVGGAKDGSPSVAIIDAISGLELFQKKESVKLASGNEPGEAVNQTLTAEPQSAQDSGEQDADESGAAGKTEAVTTEATYKEEQGEDGNMPESEFYQIINTATIGNEGSEVVDVAALKAVDGAVLRGWIEEYTIGNYAYLGEEAITEEARAALEARRNLEAIQAESSPQFGVITDNAAVRGYPAWLKLSDGLGEHDFDYFQESMFLTGEPVASYHQTADGIWSFVQGPNYRGWVETSHVAWCTREELQGWLTDGSYLVTDARLQAGEQILRMGTFLPGETDTEGNISLFLPQRDSEGRLARRAVSVASGGVHEGFLPMNTGNILQQARLLLGMPYGWGDSNTDMDCSSTMNSVYRCFGILLPRNTSSMMAAGTEVISLEGMSPEEKLEFICTQEPGTILLMKGHVVMYIGEQDGQQSILHNVVGYSLDGGKTRTDAYQCCITPLDVCTGSGTSYLERYEYVIRFSQWYK